MKLSANTEKQPVEVESVTDWKDSVKITGAKKTALLFAIYWYPRHDALFFN